MEEWGCVLPFLVVAGFMVVAGLVGFAQWMVASLDERCVEVPAAGAVVGGIVGAVWSVSMYKAHGEGLGCLVPIAFICIFIGAVSGGAFATLFLNLTGISCEGYHLYSHPPVLPIPPPKPAPIPYHW